MAEPVVELVEVTKAFGPTRAVDRVSLTIERGEFFSLLGPSGCGKTTTLRLVAGFDTPDVGEVRIAGQRVDRMRPYERNLGMVFQSYALFPHLSVQRNVAFGLEMRSVPRKDVPGRVAKALELVRLDPAVYGHRMPSELSGGQRQRVALARALVVEPPILLLDEPLGALDLKLRKEMQLELKQLNRALGITFLYVTHDQEEALTMSDRIAVMSQARVAQLGSPEDTYERPRTSFVARFIGESNFFAGLAERAADGWHLRDDGVDLRVPDHPTLAEGRRTQIAVRPEWLVLAATGGSAGRNAVAGVVSEVVYLGGTVQVRVRLRTGGIAVAAVRARDGGEGRAPWTAGDPVTVGWDPAHAAVLEDPPG